MWVNEEWEQRPVARCVINVKLCVISVCDKREVVCDQCGDEPGWGWPIREGEGLVWQVRFTYQEELDVKRLLVEVLPVVRCLENWQQIWCRGGNGAVGVWCRVRWKSVIQISYEEDTHYTIEKCFNKVEIIDGRKRVTWIAFPCQVL